MALLGVKHTPPRAGQPTASRPQLVLLLVTLLLTLPAVGLLVFHDRLEEVYIEEVVAPRLQRAYGFTSGRVSLANESEPVFCIITVVRGGVFDRLGFRPGDVPFGFKHGQARGFWGALREAKLGSSVSVRVVPSTPAGLDFRAAREIALAPSLP